MRKPRPEAADAITCPLCVKQIADDGKTEYGEDAPYKGRSLVTHFKRGHNTNRFGIDNILGVPPGTTPLCSQKLIDEKFKPAGSRGAAALAEKNREKTEVVEECEEFSLSDF